VRIDPIRLSEPDPDWAISFERERQLLTPELEPWLVVPIEHMGSTRVPDLIAKPIVDMVAVVSEIDAVGEAFGPLRDIGWVFAPEPGLDLEGHSNSALHQWNGELITSMSWNCQTLTGGVGSLFGITCAPTPRSPTSTED
jgi:GrpB-like predicted nucleotidyltransferase (UPF0157 family)